MSPEILTSLRSKLAEGPLYHPDEHAVYWTDIEGGLLHRYALDRDAAETVHSGAAIGGFTFQEDGDLLLFRKGGAIHRLSGGEVVEVLVDEIPDARETRFNDVAADPKGRIFCGTMPHGNRKGRLYRLELDGSLNVVIDELGLPNGMGWSPDLKTMYFTDTVAQTIFAFDYDVATGDLANRRDYYVHRSEGYPDGMTVDAEGAIWTALWGAGKLLRLDPEGALMLEIHLPAWNITCPSFGGRDYDELYVTSASGNQPEHGLGAGELMRLRPGVKGKPEFRSKICKVA